MLVSVELGGAAPSPAVGLGSEALKGEQKVKAFPEGNSSFSNKGRWLEAAPGCLLLTAQCPPCLDRGKGKLRRSNGRTEAELDGFPLGRDVPVGKMLAGDSSRLSKGSLMCCLVGDHNVCAFE